MCGLTAAGAACLLAAKFLPSLDGVGTKMSSTVAPGGASGPVLLSDTPKQIGKKMRRAYSGGQVTLEEQRRYGRMWLLPGTHVGYHR